MIAAEIGYEDLDCLRNLIVELHEAGRTEEAASLARIHPLVQGAVAATLGVEIDDAQDDPEFIAAMEEAEADIAAGRLIPHEEVERRLRALADA